MIECSLCLDQFDVPHILLCSSGVHRFCRPCFTKYVSAECDLLNMRPSTMITCPYVRRGQCTSAPFTKEWIRQHVDRATYRKYVAVLKQRSKAPRSRPQPTKLDDYKLEVIELLNPACPRCRATFIDFEGCCALSCRLCTCRFCAYCMETDDDLYRHVERCRYNDKDWRRGQLRWTRDQIVKLLAPLPGPDQRQVLGACRVYFQGLEIELTSVMQALGL